MNNHPEAELVFACLIALAVLCCRLERTPQSFDANRMLRDNRTIGGSR